MQHLGGTKSVGPMSDFDRPKTLPSKGRKISASGGNRSWSEEEEAYLLQTRAQKMPYKHIAAYLKKTELACRLHYHQLSHGSHRRKRTQSISSSSNSSVASRHSPLQYTLNGEPHPYSTANGDFTTSQGFYSDSLAPFPQLGSSPAGRGQHKLLLPKPRPITPEESPNRLMTTDNLRVNTASMLQTPPNPSSVDTARLQQIYDAHRGNFWASIAAEYGNDISPRSLESSWKQAPHSMAVNVVGGPHRPPTPGSSPDHRATAYPVLKPSPFPAMGPFGTMGNMSGTDSSKDYGNPLSGQVTMPSPHHQSPYGQQHQHQHQHHNPYASPAPVLPSHFVRSHGWSTPQSTGTTLGFGTAQSFGNPLNTPYNMHAGSHGSSPAPATAITALLTENKCPRHGQYCVGGHCLN